MNQGDRVGIIAHLQYLLVMAFAKNLLRLPSAIPLGEGGPGGALL